MGTRKMRLLRGNSKPESPAGNPLQSSHDSGSYDATATNTVEWQVVGVDADFSHSVPADPSGNALGPFAPGQTVRVRTRVTNANGTTTGSVRNLPITAF